MALLKNKLVLIIIAVLLLGGGGAYWGPVAHHLGRLEATIGRGGEARAHLKEAIAACEVMGAAGFAPRSRHALAALTSG